MIYTTKTRRHGGQMGFAQLIAIVTVPMAHAVERTIINLRLDNSVKAVEVYQRKNRNDSRAIALGYDSRKLRQQINDNNADIAKQHALQTRLNARLMEIRK